jgi:pimeloyl-ACP methyl ester carboxylesterase
MLAGSKRRARDALCSCDVRSHTGRAGSAVTKKRRKHADDLRAASRLVIDATTRVMDVVEGMHTTIASGPGVLGEPLSGPVRLINGVVYGGIRGVTRLVGMSIELALAPLAPILGESSPGPEREAVMAVLNGVLGDYLAETNSPLAIEMQLRHAGHALALEEEALRAALPGATGKVLVLVHGSSMSDLQWNRQGHDHGAALARDLGYTPIYVHYNSGLHISTNGRTLGSLLEQLVAAWPVPLEELVLLGHSMGGLVARSACHTSELGAPCAWRKKLTKLISLGTPHHGTPLERGGNWVDVLLGVSRYSAPLARLGKLRSAGVTDLRFGNLLDEHWAGRDRFAARGDVRAALALPDGVACYAMAATTSPEGESNFFGDGLVPVESALGRHGSARLTLAFPEGNTWIAYGAHHLDLLSRADVYEKLREWLRPVEVSRES